MEKFLLANVTCWQEEPSGDSGGSVGSPWCVLVVDTLEEATEQLNDEADYEEFEVGADTDEEHADRVVTITPSALWWRLRFEHEYIPTDDSDMALWIRLDNKEESIPGVEVLEHGLWEGTPIRRFYLDRAQSTVEAVNSVATTAS